MATPAIESLSWTSAVIVNSTYKADGKLTYHTNSQSTTDKPTANYTNYKSGTADWNSYWNWSEVTGSVPFSYDDSFAYVSVSVTVTRQILVASSALYMGSYAYSNRADAEAELAKGGSGNKIYYDIFTNSDNTYTIRYRQVENSTDTTTITISGSYNTSDHKESHTVAVSISIDKSRIKIGQTATLSYSAKIDGSDTIYYTISHAGSSTSLSSNTITGVSLGTDTYTITVRFRTIDISDSDSITVSDTVAFSWGSDLDGTTLHMLNNHPAPVTASKMSEFIQYVNDKCKTSISTSVSSGSEIDRSSSGQLAQCASALGVSYNSKSWGYKSFWQSLETAVNS